MPSSLGQSRFGRVAVHVAVGGAVWTLWSWLALHWIVAADVRPVVERCREACRHSPAELLRLWNEEQPLYVGEHPRHWYQGRLGLAPWRPVVWDPMVYGGYLVTPWWEARGRLATVWLAAEHSWSAYKLGLLITLLALPWLWWLAGWWFGRSFAAAWMSFVLCGWMFWLQPGQIWLAQGDLDMLAASGLVPVIVAGWCAWQNGAGLTVALTATLALMLLLWVYPLAGAVVVLLGVIWYLRIGAKQSAGWHLATVVLSLPVVVLHWPGWRALLDTWWLLDWHEPLQFARSSNFVQNGSEAVRLALPVAAAGISCWYLAENRSAGRTWLITMLVVAGMGFCPGLPLPEAWQPARLVGLLFPLLLIPVSKALVAWKTFRPTNPVRSNERSSVSAGTESTDSPPRTVESSQSGDRQPVPLADQPPRPSAIRQPRLLARIVAAMLALAALLAWSRDAIEHPSATGPAAAFLPAPTDQDAPFPGDTDAPGVLATLLAWLNQHTTLEARIAVEEDASCWVWSPMLIAWSGRLFANGLARETPLAQQEFRWRCWPIPTRSSESLPAERTAHRTAADHVRATANPLRPTQITPARLALAATDAESRLGEKRLQDWSPAELLAELDRWNIGWLLVRQKSTVAFLTRLPGVRVVAHDPKTGWHLLARPFPGYFEHGQGRLWRAQPGLLTFADLQPQEHRCVLRFAYVPGLVPSLDRCRTAPASGRGTGWPQLQLLLAGPQSRLTIRFQESANLVQQ